ncbi:MAG: hypothetical protein ACLUOI_23065 [Eisenbergiella sp.]
MRVICDFIRVNKAYVCLKDRMESISGGMPAAPLDEKAFPSPPTIPASPV